MTTYPALGYIDPSSGKIVKNPVTDAQKAYGVTIGPLANPTTASGTSTGASGYNASPTPTRGKGAFGMVPGQINLPNPYGDLSSVYPNLSGANQSVSGNIMAELGGQLSPGTIRQLQDSAAAFGISSGMPGSQFQGYTGLRNLGLASEALTQQGIKDYNATLPTISSTQTVNPALEAQIAETNSINAAAPDPALAAQEQERLFDKYLSSLMAGGGGTLGRSGPSGGTGTGGVRYLGSKMDYYGDTSFI